MGQYDVAQVCMNGHVVNDSYLSSPEFRQEYCSRCGEKTIKECPNCNVSIHGDYKVQGVVSFRVSEHKADAYCYNCGKPYPWTEANIKAVKDLVEFDDELNDNEAQEIIEVLPDLLVETPKTKVAIVKFKKFIDKAGTVTFEAVKEIIVGIATEAISKALYG